MYNFCPYCGMKIKDVEELPDEYFTVKFVRHTCYDSAVHYFKDTIELSSFITYAKTVEIRSEEYYALKHKVELRRQKSLSDAALKARAKECNIELYGYVDEVSENMVDEVFENMHKRLCKSRLKGF